MNDDNDVTNNLIVDDSEISESQSVSCSNVSMADLEDFTNNFKRKPITESISEIARNTAIKPLHFDSDQELLEKVVMDMISRNITSNKAMQKFTHEMQRKHRHL